MSGGGKNCAVFGCHNNQRKLKKWRESECTIHQDLLGKDCPCLEPFRFFGFPKGEGSLPWIKAVNRKKFNPSKNSYVCSTHFIDDRPTDINPNPILNLGYSIKIKEGRKPPKKKANKKAVLNAMTSQESMNPKRLRLVDELDDSVQAAVENVEPIEIQRDATEQNDSAVIKYHNVGTQTNDEVIYFHTYAKKFEKSSRSIGSQAKMPHFGFKSHVTSDRICKFYTGTTLKIFNSLVASLETLKPNFKMLLCDQILLVLLRIKLGLLFMDLGLRFNISQQLASNIFKTWLPILSDHLKDVIVWLPRDILRAIMPESFKKCYPETTCIIDCFETFLQRPCNLKARAQTWSTYKSHNTCKFLIAIAPNGFIMFKSTAYGGRASDKYITSQSGFLKYLLPGDEVMADRGFTISDDLIARRVKLNIPAFMKGRDQLTEMETTQTRRIANVRIHVERVIRRVKCFRILSSNIRIKSVRGINQVLTICCALCNLGTHIIKHNENLVDV